LAGLDTFLLVSDWDLSECCSPVSVAVQANSFPHELENEAKDVFITVAVVADDTGVCDLARIVHVLLEENLR